MANPDPKDLEGKVAYSFEYNERLYEEGFMQIDFKLFLNNKQVAKIHAYRVIIDHFGSLEQALFEFDGITEEGPRIYEVLSQEGICSDILGFESMESMEYGQFIAIKYLGVPPKLWSKGHGGSALDIFLNYIPPVHAVFLYASQPSGENVKNKIDLIDFYGKHGFEQAVDDDDLLYLIPGMA